MKQGINLQALARLQTLLTLHQASLSVFQQVYMAGPPIIAPPMTDCL